MPQPKRDWDLQLASKLKIDTDAEPRFGGPLWACEKCFTDIEEPGTLIGDNFQSREFHADKLRAVLATPLHLDEATRNFCMGKISLLHLLTFLKTRPETKFEVAAGKQSRVQVFAIDSLPELIHEYEGYSFLQLLNYCSKNPLISRRSLTWRINLHNSTDGVQTVVLEKLPQESSLAFDLAPRTKQTTSLKITDQQKSIALEFVSSNLKHEIVRLVDCQSITSDDRHFDPKEQRYVISIELDISNQQKRQMLAESPDEERLELERFFSEPSRLRLTINDDSVVAVEWLSIDLD